MEPAIAQLQQWIDQAKTITFFTGAGISTESGIPDFVLKMVYINKT
nr:hypothetical protein [Priestia abyssalis]